MYMCIYIYIERERDITRIHLTYYKCMFKMYSIQVCIYIYIHTINLYMCVYKYIYIYIHIYIHTHTHTHVYIHTYIHMMFICT